MTVEKVFVAEKIKEYRIRQYISTDVGQAGISHSEIKRTPLGTRIIVYAMRPGLVIGTGGENIKRITEVLKSRFRVENPHIEVKQVETPELDAQIMAQRIAFLLERGFYFKKIVYRTLDSIMAAGARGVEIRICGKVPSDRAREWIFKKGYIRHCGETVKTEVDVGYYTALLKSGIVGVRIRLMPPTVTFPDELLVGDGLSKLKLSEKPKPEEQAQQKPETKEVAKPDKPAEPKKEAA